MTINIDLSDANQQAEFYDLFLLALTVWREARGETLETKRAVAWAIKNRAIAPGWWGGPSLATVILRPFQFSSFNYNDPNAVKWPVAEDSSWMASLQIAQGVVDGSLPDNTNRATHYFDRSLDDKPPSWATDASMVHTVDIGSLHFYRRA